MKKWCWRSCQEVGGANHLTLRPGFSSSDRRCHLLVSAALWTNMDMINMLTFYKHAIMFTFRRTPSKQRWRHSSSNSFIAPCWLPEVQLIRNLPPHVSRWSKVKKKVNVYVNVNISKDVSVVLGSYQLMLVLISSWWCKKGLKQLDWQLSLVAPWRHLLGKCLKSWVTADKGTSRFTCWISSDSWSPTSCWRGNVGLELRNLIPRSLHLQ